MKLIVRRCLLGCLAAIIAACVTVDRSRAIASTQSSHAINSSPSTNQMLVTFQDERVDQVPVADPANGYRRRGDYQNSTWSQRIAAQLAEDYGLQFLAQWPINTLGIHCVVYQVPANQSVDSVLRQLEQDKRIDSVQTMKSFRVMGETYNDPYFNLQSDMRAMHIEAAHRLTTGRNIKIALIDTGVDAHHPDLIGQVSHSDNFVENSSAGGEDIHGTAVAGIIAASADNHQGIVGMAPGSKLIALKACWQSSPEKPEAVCNTFTLALAMNAAITLKADIVNLSLAGPSDPLIERLINKAMDEGVIVVASTPEKSASNNGFPASMKRVIAVKTAQRQGPAEPLDEHAISAPGDEILTTLPHGTYNFMSGSSFAAAHVSGLIALLLELKPHLATGQLVSILLDSMRRPAADQGLERVDACAAIAGISGSPACSDATAKAG